MKTPKPYIFDGDDQSSAKRHAPATERNFDAIGRILQRILPRQGTVLEIASGTGEHIIGFARMFPSLYWMPSDVEPAALKSIAAWRAEAGLPNLAAPVQIDVTSEWPLVSPAAILCINMLHISPWSATKALFAEAASQLPPGAPLYVYGPFLQKGVATAQSNLAFDRSLKSRNPEWGLRAVSAVADIAVHSGFSLEEIAAMPANNLSLIFRRCQRPILS